MRPIAEILMARPQVEYGEGRLVILRLVRPVPVSHHQVFANRRAATAAGHLTTPEGIAGMTRLYVGNLPFDSNESTVRDLFARHGTVGSVTLVNDRETGMPRGFGFVEMESSEATKAMQALNGFTIGGRPLKVNESQERGRPAGIGGWRGRE